MSRLPSVRRRLPLAVEPLEDRCTPALLTVNTFLDENDGVTVGGVSLRDALAAAADGDTIEFAPSLNGQTIALTHGELLVANDVTITGPGANQLTVSGSLQSRVFDIETAANVAINGLSIANGRNASSAPHSTLGGNIYNAGTLTLTGTTVEGGSITTGGGIYNAGTLTLTASTVTGNTSLNGGGIYNVGTLNVANSTLSGNIARNGAGLYCTGTLTVTGSTLSGNTSTINVSSGGALFLVGGTASVADSTLSGNQVVNHGGAIYLTECSLTVSNSTLYGNSTSGLGGGIYVANEAGSTAAFTNSTVTANSAGNVAAATLSRTFISPPPPPAPTPLAKATLSARVVKAKGKYELRLMDLASGAVTFRQKFPTKVKLLQQDLNGDGVADFLVLIKKGKKTRRLAFSATNGSRLA